MGQASACCDGDRDVIDTQQKISERIELQTSIHKRILDSASPVQEETKVNSLATKVQIGLKSKSKVARGGMKISEPIRNRIKELGRFNSSGPADRNLDFPQHVAYQLENGIIYFGEWQGEDIHGKGVFLLPDGSFLDARITKNEVNGIARIIYPNGDYYQGQFRNNRANGQGKLREGIITYQGYFKDNLPHGDAFQLGQNFRFIGSFDKGIKKKGKLAWQDEFGNFTYIGQFKDNLFHGEGTLDDKKQTITGYFQSGKLVRQIRIQKNK